MRSPVVSAEPDGSLRQADSLRWQGYAQALLITAVCTVAALPFADQLGLVNIIMLYLLGTTLGSLRLGRGPAVLLATASMLAFDYFFVPPLLSFNVQDSQFIFTLAVMLLVALVIANLMVGIRRHRDLADARERRTAVLYSMSRELAVAADAAAMAAAAMRHIHEVFHCTAAVLIDDDGGHLEPISPPPLPAFDLEIARAVADSVERRIDEAIYLPLQGSRNVKGVIVLRPHGGAPPLHAEQLNLMDAFAAQLALSLQRARFAESAEAARVAAEHALMRNTLLASISHDLRTPLAAIAGAGSLIAQPEYALNADRRNTLGVLIERKARDMSQLLSNVLELMQMEFGSGALRADWHSIDDLIGLALRTNEARLAQWRIALSVPGDFPLILVEPTLIVKTLSNLLENAAKYTPPGTTVSISAVQQDGGILLVVADDGPGLPPGDPERLFEKFQRGHAESNIIGVGLGLAICRAAVGLHRGTIRAMPSPGGGTRFEIILPVETKLNIAAGET
jgi:two-component system sensor histidine kinase KdpD